MLRICTIDHACRFNIISAILSAFCLACLAGNAYSGKSEAMRSGPKGEEPEPMVFDLIDRLGGPKGKAEINAFLDYSPGGDKLEWSPEIEYTFARGHAVELELPVNNSSLKEYKITLQGTFGKSAKRRMIHGWQAIGRREIHKKAYTAAFLYLNDFRLSDKWNMINMLGVRGAEIAKSDDIMGLSNNSVFYRYTERLALGIELNSEIREREWRYRLTPQLQFNLSKNKIFHLGGGPSQLNEKNETEWLLTSRLVYDF